MPEHRNRDKHSLDSQAFAVVLSAMFICTLACIAGPMVGERPAQLTMASAASQLNCPRL
jgi:hypothetical protein